MLARLGFFDEAPGWDASWVTEAARSADGCLGVAHIRCREDQSGVSLSVFTEAAAVDRAVAAIAAAATARGHEGRPPDRQGLYDVAHASTGRGAAGFARFGFFDDPYDETRFADRSRGVLDFMATLDGFVRGLFLVLPSDQSCISATLWTTADAFGEAGPKIGAWHGDRGDPPLPGQILTYDITDASFD